MLNVVLVRHSQTEANRDGVVQGQADSPLTEKGEASAVVKAGKLRGVSIDHVFCSDLPRAVRTMELIASAHGGLPAPVFLPELREINFGKLAGKAKDDIMPVILKHKADTSKRYPGGESGDDLIRRTLGFFDFLFARHWGRTVLVVSHYGVMETAIRRFADHPAGQPVEIAEDDVVLLEFREPGKARLARL